MKVDQETAKAKAKGLEIQAENGFIHAHMPGIQSFQWVKFCPNNIQGQEGQQDEKMEEYFGNRSPLSFLIPGLVLKLWM